MRLAGDTKQHATRTCRNRFFYQNDPYIRLVLFVRFVSAKITPKQICLIRNPLFSLDAPLGKQSKRSITFQQSGSHACPYCVSGLPHVKPLKALLTLIWFGVVTNQHKENCMTCLKGCPHASQLDIELQDCPGSGSQAITPMVLCVRPQEFW